MDNVSIKILAGEASGNKVKPDPALDSEMENRRKVCGRKPAQLLRSSSWYQRHHLNIKHFILKCMMEKDQAVPSGRSLRVLSGGFLR